jgi:Na+/H+ antiporter NhaD/arsenite permease-like protein
MSHEPTTGTRGPTIWVIVALIAAAIGALAGVITPVEPYTPPPADSFPQHIEGAAGETVIPPSPGRALAHAGAPTPLESSTLSNDDDHHTRPDIPLWLLGPFAVLLLSIALMPFLLRTFWNAHYPAVAFACGAFVIGFYLSSYGAYGRHHMLHAGLEFFQFIGLVGALFVATGGIVLRINARGAPAANTGLLLVGAILSDFIGTAGASVLLIRPFMNINQGRLRPLHVVFFIFIVSNCGGSLTPIGDPPLYLGFLKGVPFFWTLQNLWQEWIVCIGLLLFVFFVIDTIFSRADAARADRDPVFAERLQFRIKPDSPAVSIRGAVGMICLVFIVLAVFIDPLLQRADIETHGVPFAPIVQIAIAFVAYKGARPEHHEENQFNFHPVQEVGFLFAGIFFTMAPALGYLAIHGPSLGLQTPTHYYFATGALSAILDNAPTYLNFLQTGLASEGYPLTPEGIHAFINGSVAFEHRGAPVIVKGSLVLAAISLGAVFFGAATYIGNAPNFMVKSIAEANGVRMPGFLGYLRYSVLILLPILVIVWFVFLRL